MTNRRRVVVSHLENISGNALEKYHPQIRQLVKGRSGIYALYRNHNLYYVGLATNLMRRLKQHLRDHHERKWNRFSVYVTGNNDHMKELESLLLRIVNPRGNIRSGKIASSDNLRPKLSKLIKEKDDDRRARILGGNLTKRRLRKKATSKRGSNILAGSFDRAIALCGLRAGYEYRGSLKKNGEISYDGTSYPSPTAAASAAVGRRINGWSFWKYRNKNGAWVPLSTLK